MCITDSIICSLAGSCLCLCIYMFLHLATCHVISNSYCTLTHVIAAPVPNPIGSNTGIEANDG